jgi:hypothetical protein
MPLYTYRDVLLCAACGATQARSADRRKPRLVAGHFEFDCPQHCDRCGLFLANALTEIGRDFARRMCSCDPDELTPALRIAVASWRAFYFLD